MFQFIVRPKGRELIRALLVVLKVGTIVAVHVFNTWSGLDKSLAYALQQLREMYSCAAREPTCQCD